MAIPPAALIRGATRTTVGQPRRTKAATTHQTDRPPYATPPAQGGGRGTLRCRADQGPDVRTAKTAGHAEIADAAHAAMSGPKPTLSRAAATSASTCFQI